MASVQTFEIFGEKNSVLQKPPIPSRPGSGKFHNRGSGKLFPSTQYNKLFNNEDNESILNDESINPLAIVLHPKSKTNGNLSEPSTPKSVPSYCRQTASAKARTRERKGPGARSQRQRPVSAGSYRPRIPEGTAAKPAVIDLASKVIPDLFEIEKEKILALPDPREHSDNVFNDKPPMHFDRPSSGKLSDFELDGLFSSQRKKDKTSRKGQKQLMPCVYGLQNHRQYYGSMPDLSSANCNYEQFPYKITHTKKNLAIEYSMKQSDIPTTLEPLLPWLQKDVPADVLGVSAEHCLVFLAPANWQDLPEVPEPQSMEDDLPYILDVTTPKPWNPKKYPHYSCKQPVEDWVCKHGAHVTAADHEEVNSHTVYRQTFRIPRMRTADIIKKEILDLENLLKGIGSKESDCGMVQYQSEISAFQSMLNDTLEMVPERLKNPKPQSPKDRFGLNKMCAEHDVIISNIIQRVKECREELAEVEKEAGIETARQYFRKRSNSVL